jgi:hypothetical protein
MKILLFAGLTFLLLINPSFANVDLCLEKDPTSESWVKSRGCSSSPEDWAIAALGDIYTFEYEDTDNHLSRIKNAYFSDQGWQEFEATFKGFLDRINANKHGMSGRWNFEKNFIVDEKTREEDKASAHLHIPLYLIYGSGASDVVVDIIIEGIRNYNKKISPDSPRDEAETWQYDYKINNFKIMPKK